MNLKNVGLVIIFGKNERCDNEWILPRESLKMGDGHGLENTEEGTHRTKMKVKQ